jgi:hypothetical protein
MNEKRQFQRFKNRQQVWCEGQDKKIQVESTDMSKGGMAILTKDAPKVGSQMKVSFVVPDGGNVSVNMEVVWRKKEVKKGEGVAIGLRVLDFEKGQETFDQFVSSNLENLPEDEDDEDDQNKDGDEDPKKEP